MPDFIQTGLDWLADTINEFTTWLESMTAEEVARQMSEAAAKILSAGISNVIATYAAGIEVVFFAVLLAPLFLVNMITASVDIFAGITPIYQTDGNNATALYEDSQKPIYMIDKNSPEKIPLFSGFDLLPPFPDDEDVEDPALASVRNRVQEMWRELIQTNPDVVMNETKGYSDPDRYYPNVRAFIQENSLGFGSNSMYRALANAMLSGAAVGTGVKAEDVPQMPQIPLETLHKSEQMPKRLIRPFVAYGDENFLMLEASAQAGLFIPGEPYLTEIELDEDLEQITLDEGNYLKISGYTVTYTETIEFVNEEGEVSTETITIIKYINTYLHQTYYDVYKQLYQELIESGWLKPQVLAERFNELRDNPNAKNNDELARLLGLPIVYGEVVGQMYTEANPYLWTNEYMVSADFVKENDAEDAEGIERYFSVPADGFGLSFYARYDSGQKTMADYIAIDSFYSAKALWVDFIQNNADIVYNPLRSYEDVGRYTPKIREFIANCGVTPGSEEMHRAIAEALYSFQLSVGDKPVNLWVDPAYVNSYHLRERPEQAYYSSRLSVTNDVTLAGHILSSPTVSAVFWGVTLISIVLCVAFSIYAVIRSMGDFDLQKPVGKVLGLAAKSMLMFLIIPVFCVCAVTLSGVVLGQLNYLLGSGGDSGEPVSVSGAMFYAAVSPQAVLLPGEDSILMSMSVTEDGTWIQKKTDNSAQSWLARTQQYEQLRQDYVYGRKSVSILDIEQMRNDFDVIQLASNGYLFIMSLAAWVLLVLMIMVVVVFLRRIFDIVMLYLTAPLFVSTIPLDDGQVFKGWREKFIGAVVMGFGSLVTFKLMLLLLPLIWDTELKLHPGSAVNTILKATFTLGGVFATYKSHTLIASMLSQNAEEAEGGAMALMMEPVQQAKQLANVVKNQATMGARQLVHKGLDAVGAGGAGAGNKNQSYLYESKEKSSSSTVKTSDKNTSNKNKSDTNKSDKNTQSKKDGAKNAGDKKDKDKTDKDKTDKDKTGNKGAESPNKPKGGR